MITGYFGLPGSGKTSMLTMFAQKELKKIKKGKSKYEKVLTNYYCKGCYKIDYSDLGKYDISNCLILLDEITLDADSRNFKQFDQTKKMFFLLHRHFDCDVIYFTQQWDGVDKKIRDITQNLFYVKKSTILPFLTVASKIYRVVEINEFNKEIIQGYRFPNIIESIFFTPRIACFRKQWYMFFDTKERPNWDPYIYEKWDNEEIEVRSALDDT